MGLLNIIDPVLNFIFSPILQLNHFLGIFLLSVVLSVIVTIAYKYTTNQELMKQLKDDLKTMGQEIKKISKEDPQKAMSKQKELMQKNMEYTKHSFRSTFYTIIPLLIIFSWMHANIAYLPIQPGEQFNMTLYTEAGYRGDVLVKAPEGILVVGNATQQVDGRNKAGFTLQGDDPGTFDVVFDLEGELVSKEVIISSWRDYSPTLKSKRGITGTLFGWLYSSKAGYIDSESAASQIMIHNKPIKPFGSLNIFGWKPGWLFAYIFFSIVASMGLRKVLKVY